MISRISLFAMPGDHVARVAMKQWVSRWRSAAYPGTKFSNVLNMLRNVNDGSCGTISSSPDQTLSRLTAMRVPIQCVATRRSPPTDTRRQKSDEDV